MAQMRLENLKTRSPQYRKIRSHGTEKTGRHCKTMNTVVSMHEYTAPQSFSDPYFRSLVPWGWGGWFYHTFGDIAVGLTLILFNWRVKGTHDTNFFFRISCCPRNVMKNAPQENIYLLLTQLLVWM